MILRSLFRTKVLQMAKHKKIKVKTEAKWVWNIAFLSTIIIGIAEFLKLENPLTSTVYSGTVYLGLVLLILSLWVFAAAMDARKQYLWFWQILNPKETIPDFSKKGIYSIVRFPRELGLVLLIAGLSGTFSLNFALLFSILLLFATMFKVSSLDRTRMDKYGKTYIDYTRSTKKLIPYIY